MNYQIKFSSYTTRIIKKPKPTNQSNKQKKYPEISSKHKTTTKSPGM
jgi:hypothetical protein